MVMRLKKKRRIIRKNARVKIPDECCCRYDAMSIGS